MVIPKLIHQTYSSGFDNIKPEIRGNIQRMRAQNPDYEYRFYSNEDRLGFVRDNYGLEMLKRFERIDPVYGAARADFFRYLLMHKLGGVYLDVKSGPTRPLNQVIKDSDRYVLSRWNDSPDGRYANWGNHPQIPAENRPAFQQWFIISEPGHPFLGAVIDKVSSNIDAYNALLHIRSSWTSIMVTTGEVCYTKAIVPILSQHDHRIVMIEEELGIYYTLFEGKAGLYAHYQQGRHYSAQTKPLIRQSRAMSIPLAIANQAIGLARYVRYGKS